MAASVEVANQMLVVPFQMTEEEVAFPSAALKQATCPLVAFQVVEYPYPAQEEEEVVP